ncbi:MAG: hypothetical protein ABFC24_09210 [Methanoregulaceae archaeon]
MKQKTLMYGSFLAAAIIVVAVCVGMVTGFSFAKAFISVDPVSDKNVGDLFTVTGTTNLPAGTELLVQIEPASFEPESGVDGVFSGTAGGADVIAGTGGTNTWSLDVNTSTLNPVKMRVNVSVFTGDMAKGNFSTSEPFGTWEFTLHPGPASGQYIKIDPVADKTTGDLLIITGTTNLPAGTELLVQAGNTNGGARVRAGTGGVNLFSSPVDTTTMEPGTTKITVTNWIGDLEKGDYRKGDTHATSSFTLNGEYLTTETPVKATITKDDYLHANGIGDRSVGDQFLVTGTTSLPVGTEVLWEVTPASLLTDPDQSGTFTGAMANSRVSKGTGNANRVSYAMDTYVLLPGEYNVTISTSAGDISQGDYRKGAVSGSVLFTLKQGTTSVNTGDYIKIDPVAGKTTGDLLIVSGSTNLPVGTILMVQAGNYAGDATVRTGTGGINRFSAPVDTAILKPGTLTITVSRMNDDPAQTGSGTGAPNATASFTLNGDYLATDTAVQATITKDDYIRITAIGDKKAGDQFLITGTTSLSAGVSLIWQIMPYTGTIPANLDLNATGIMANNPVTKGNGTANRVSLAVDLDQFKPGEYVVIVGEVKGDPGTRDLRIGRPIGSARFTVN